MEKSLRKFRHWRLGKPFERNGVVVGIVTGLKITSHGVFAIISKPGERRYYRLADHPHMPYN